MKVLDSGIRLVTCLLALCFTAGAGAQENLDQGKSPAQLFASDCAICHKSPQGLAKAGGVLGLDRFLREHYTASKETAAAIANYLKAMDTGPAPAARSTKRAAKGDEKKKTGGKPGEEKGTEKPDANAASPATSESKSPEKKSPEAKSSETKPSEPKPADIVAPEPKSGESKPSAPSAGDAKPAEAGKSEKPE
jgi:hypothetical protein